MALRQRRMALKSLKQKDTIGILLLGDAEIGKTSLIKRWLDDEFSNAYDPTSEDFYHRLYVQNSINVGYVDLGGSGQFSAMEDLYITNTDGIIYVFEIGNEKTINSLERYCKKVQSIRKEKEVPSVLVGTKSDQHRDFHAELTLPCFEELSEKPRQYLTSSKENTNVKEAFEYLIESITFDMLPTKQRVRSLTNEFQFQQNKKKRFGKCEIL